MASSVLQQARLATILHSDYEVGHTHDEPGEPLSRAGHEFLNLEVSILESLTLAFCLATRRCMNLEAPPS